LIADRAKSLLKRFASPVLDQLGLYDRQLRQHLSASSWTIVMYHRVIDDVAMDPFGLGMCVTRRHFDEQLRYFNQYFSPIGLSAAVDRLSRGESLPDRALSVTFDDGYLDNLTTALPVLRQHGVPAALFVPTGGLDDDEPLWWDRVISAVASTSRREFVPGEVGLPLAEERLSLGRWQRKAAVERLLDSLWTLPIEQVLAIVSRIEQQLAPARPGVPVARRMTSSQVRQMHLAGVEIGAHSVRHPNLTLESPAVVREEMQASRAVLENLCDAPINGFAYPAGWKNADAEAAAAEAGFRYAVATTRGVNDRNALNLFSLARVGMPDTRVSDLKRALSTARQIPGPESASS
jgi:peptidoglycan/xylan/chitin deacetylase (PgdA/CDA1 family)